MGSRLFPMFSSAAKWATSILQRSPSTPLIFPTSGFDIISDSMILEEEQSEAFKSGHYYPVNIGDVFASKYQVLGKLGFGTTSTVWLAQDLQARQHVAMKIYTLGVDRCEFDIYEQLSEGDHSHPGYPHIRTALNTFTISRNDFERPERKHFCLVQRPMWDSFQDLLYRNPTRRFTPELLRAGLTHIFRALDYLHTECKLVHTDIKADNILIELRDKSILKAFTKAEMESPSPRKLVDGKLPVYMSRKFERPRKFGDVVLSDFGAAVCGDIKRNHDAQPAIYRSPEVMLKVDWSYPVDIWNVGAMIWDLFEGKPLFCGNDSSRGKYMTRMHLAEAIAMLGPPPLDLLQRGKRSWEFFTENGEWKAEADLPPETSLGQSEEFLTGKEKETFLDFMRGMLAWRPEDRLTAKQLLEHRWIKRL